MKIIWMLIYLLSLLSLSGECSGALKQERPFNKITVVSDDNYPPYVFRDVGGNIQGIIVDQWKLWEKKTGIKVNLIGMDWDKALETMEQGKSDVIDTIFFTEKRAQLYDFTRPYAKIDVPIFFQKNISGIDGIKSVQGFSVGVKKGDACIEVFKRNGIIKELAEYNSYEDIIKDASKGKVHVFCIDKPPALYYLNKYNLIEDYRYSLSLYTGEFHRAVKKGRKDLLAVVEGGFSEISKEEYAAIERKWYGATILNTSVYVKYIGISLGVIGTVFILLLSFNLILRKKVKTKTFELIKTNLLLQEEISEREKTQLYLRESEELYTRLVDTIPDLIVRTDLDGKILFVNDYALHISGYNREEIEGQNILVFIASEDRNRAIQNLHLMQEERIGPQEYQLKIKDGREIPIEVNGDVLRNEDGIPFGHVHVCRDITLRNQAEEELRKSEATYRFLTENMNDIVWTADIDFNITYDSPSVEKILGYTQEEKIGKKATTSMTTESYVRAMSTLELELQSEYQGDADPDRTVRLELQYLHKNGTLVWMESITSAIRDDAGKIIGFHGVSRDITERKRAEESLHQREAYLSAIIENQPGLVWLKDTESRFLAVNHTFAISCGKQRGEEFLGKTDLDIWPKELAEKYRRDDVMTMKTRRPTILEEPIFDKGEIRWFETFKTPVLDEQGVIIGTTGYAHDITDRKRAEEEKKKLENQLNQAQKMESIGTLAGGIAHDFNNLLMGILGNTSLILMQVDKSQTFYDRLKNIEDYVQRGSDLTKQLLGFARSGKYEAKPTNLGEFIRESSELFGRTKKEIRIYRNIQEDLWVAEVDQGQIEQVLLNLYVNAWQAMPGGGDLYLSAENVVLGEVDVIPYPYSIDPGKYVKITVTDTGMGMSETIKDRIFEPFFTTKEKGRGTGLGLASAYGIIKNHGGFIQVESKEGHGTSFMIYLPSSNKVVDNNQNAEYELQKGHETVLLIDDEEMILDVGSNMLEGLGYRVMTAIGGKQGLVVYEQNKDEIDIVILDMIMPEIGGRETFGAMLQIDPFVKVLLSSGYSLDGQANEIMQNGCKGFIQKPFTMLELSKKIRGVLDNC